MNAAEAGRDGAGVEKGATCSEGGQARAPEPAGDTVRASDIFELGTEGGGELVEFQQLFGSVIVHFFLRSGRSKGRLWSRRSRGARWCSWSWSRGSAW